ncbi:MAG: tellurite resistance TerB family protein [Microcoleaceae cyanobacterium]
MGLFDSLAKSNSIIQASEVTFSPTEAMSALALSIVAVDGDLADEELDLMIHSLGRMQLFRSYSEDMLFNTINQVLSTLNRRGYKKVLDAAVESLPHYLHETAFAVATDLVLADGEVTEEEENVLTYLSQTLNIQENTAQEIVRVMLIKNKG